MTLTNQTKNTVITDNLEVADTLLKASIGLLGQKKAYPIYFKTRFGIHTFTLPFSIDIVILDKNFRVTITKTVKPNRVLFWNPHYYHVIELPQGFIQKYEIKIGDILLID